MVNVNGHVVIKIAIDIIIAIKFIIISFIISLVFSYYISFYLGFLLPPMDGTPSMTRSNSEMSLKSSKLIVIIAMFP